MFSTVDLPQAPSESAAPGVPPFAHEATHRFSSTPVDRRVEEGKLLQIGQFFIHSRRFGVY
jgi:hypothetical protein